MYVEIPRPCDATELNKWRRNQVGRHPLPNRTDFINFFRKRYNQRQL